MSALAVVIAIAVGTALCIGWVIANSSDDGWGS